MTTATRSQARLTLFAMMAADVVLFAGAYWIAYLLRFEGNLPDKHLHIFLRTIAAVVVGKFALAHAFGLYQGMWRYTSLVDLVNVLKLAATATISLAAGLLLFGRDNGFSRAVVLLDGLLTFVLVGGLRVGIRLYFTQNLSDFMLGGLEAVRSAKQSANRVIILGAGNTGEAILREFQNRRGAPYAVVGFLDDDERKAGKYLHGVPVLGRIENLDTVVSRLEVTEVLLAMPSADARSIRRIIETCEALGLKCRTVPTAGEVLDDKVSIATLRDVTFEDLLGRAPVQLDTAKIGGYLEGRRVMVTGAGGSIGSELCRQIARFKPSKLILLDRAESPLYDVEMELKHARHTAVPHCALLVGIQNRDALEQAFAEHRPEVVFHAAAYKHVPMLESHPWEAVYNNIVGTRNVLELCAQFSEVSRFVLVSTDKAVRPTSVMGASKRVAELLTQAYDKTNAHTAHQAVRFGNVVGSAGSVIPLFKKQIERRGAVTVTHPDVTRYFMTIPEASQLILQAGAMGEGGEIFILDMGKPIKIVDLAKDLIRLSGFEPELDIPIEFIGLRPGEKLFEELITSGEGIVRTPHEKILVLRHAESGDASGGLFDAIDELVRLAHAHDGEGIRAVLRRVIPEYAPPESVVEQDIAIRPRRSE